MLSVLGARNPAATGPSWAHDFRSGVMHPSVSFTRATTATRINAQGLIETVGVNTPRLDYDPVTKACRGLLCEAERTNLVPYSSAIASWEISNGSVITDTVTSPDGSISADVFIVNNQSTAPRFTCDVVASTTYSFSFYVHRELTTAAWLRIRFSTLSGSVSFWFNTDSLTFGTAVGSGITTGAVEDAGNGWYRVGALMTYGANDGGSRSVAVAGVIGDNSTIADQGSEIVIWGAQSEIGAFPTSYIPTSGSAVTRAADNASVVGDAFSAWYRQDQGTLLVDSTVLGISASASEGHVFAGASSGAWTDNVSMISGYGTSTQRRFDVVAGGVQQASVSFSGASAAGPQVMAVAYQNNSVIAAYNGALGSQDTSASIPVVDRLGIGNRQDGFAQNVLSGHIRRIVYFPRRLLNSEVQGLTT